MCSKNTEGRKKGKMGIRNERMEKGRKRNKWKKEEGKGRTKREKLGRKYLSDIFILLFSVK